MAPDPDPPPPPADEPGAGQGLPPLPGRVEPDLMSFGDHLEELRARVLWSILGIVPVFVAALAFGTSVLELLIRPAQAKLREGGQSTSLLATAPFETFGTMVQVAFVITILIGSPWIIAQLWLFVAPGLYRAERSFFHRLAPLSVALTVASVSFVYWVILPVVLAFFIGFGSGVGGDSPETAPLPQGVVLPMAPVLEADPVAPEVGSYWVHEARRELRFCIGLDSDGAPIVLGSALTKATGVLQQYKVSEYVKTLLNMALAFGIGFQTPVVVLLLGWVGLTTRQTLAKYRRHACAVCAIAGAVLTPAEPVSMVLLAAPLYALFELGMLLLWLWPTGSGAKPGTNIEREAGDE